MRRLSIRSTSTGCTVCSNVAIQPLLQRRHTALNELARRMASFGNECTALSLGDALKQIFFPQAEVFLQPERDHVARGRSTSGSSQKRQVRVVIIAVIDLIKRLTPIFSLQTFCSAGRFSLISRKDRLRKKCCAGVV